MRRILIHTHSFGGHQLEYIHHLYMGAIQRKDTFFLFLVPNRFQTDSKKLEWPPSKNTSVIVMNQEEMPPANCGLLRKGWRNSLTIRKYCKMYSITDVLTISIMEYLPFLPFVLNCNVRFSGIVYRIYLYEWKEESLSMKIQDSLKYWIMSHFKVFDHIFICNDSASALCLNRIFNTNKYKYLPDPVVSLKNYSAHDLREELDIPSSNIVFFHPGTMDTYKNTLGILRALMKLESDKYSKISLILAGRVVPGIRNEFDSLYKQLESRMQIIFIEGYLSFERLADLFVTSDYVLVPYSVKSQSSGVVGHAAYYGKPVIAVRNGIIGKMVRRWNLGKLLNSSSDDSISQAILQIVDSAPFSTQGNTYAESHSIKMFTESLLA